MTLNEQLLSLLKSSSLVDYDQRSALGLARTWVEKQKLPGPSLAPGYQQRDALASRIIELLQEFPEDDHRVALAEAREIINEFYVVESPLGHAKQKGEYKKQKPVTNEAKLNDT